MTDSRDLHGAKREMFDQDDSRNLSFWKRSEISVINGVAFVSVLEYQKQTFTDQQNIRSLFQCS